MPARRTGPSNEVERIVRTLERYRRDDVMEALAKAGIGTVQEVAPPLVTVPLALEAIAPLFRLLGGTQLDYVHWNVVGDDPKESKNCLVSVEGAHAQFKGKTAAKVYITRFEIATIEVKTKGDAGVLTKKTFSAKKGTLLLLRNNGTEVSAFLTPP